MPPKSSKALKLFSPRTYNIYLNTSVTPHMSERFRPPYIVNTLLEQRLQTAYSLLVNCQLDKEMITDLFENHFEVMNAAIVSK